ncbi:hypothetical protein [Pseudolabrys taiwanensis]|uniref:hypothetical protein n=1 Tax=Pseudolabrys taiwanensis TaxID=331696 RepID=UPI0013B36CD7|nr:hypothetical protein [Pseudolabrys taiwanensis]
MADISHGLMIKFGLANAPSESLSERWASLTRIYINGGMDREAAGDRAAKELFPDYQTRFYASEADTISYLLQQAGDKK